MTDMQMQVRRVNVDFSDAQIHWNPMGPEFSHIFNAFSSLAPQLEPFLIRTMRAAKAQVPPSDEVMLADIDLFNSQEGAHHRQHSKFNKLLDDAGYDLGREEAKARAFYRRLTDEKSLRFCMAYCDGFETLGPAISGYFFDRSPALMEQWDEPTTFLWLWHVAEEYEHRAVVYSVYNQLFGDHWYRVYGFWYSQIHILGYVLKNSNRMIKRDLASGVIQSRGRSRYRQVRTLLDYAAYAAPKLVRVHRRSYDPSGLPPIRNAQLVLARASEKYTVADQ